jgi:hypothetical protein
LRFCWNYWLLMKFWGLIRVFCVSETAQDCSSLTKLFTVVLILKLYMSILWINQSSLIGLSFRLVTYYLQLKLEKERGRLSCCWTVGVERLDFISIIARVWTSFAFLINFFTFLLFSFFWCGFLNGLLNCWV